MSQKPQLRMWRSDLEDLPEVDLPEGCELRHYQAGDGAHWERIISTSFDAEPGRFSFDRMMRSSACYRPERVLFVVHRGRPVATASAWYHPDRFPGTGTIHYVGVEPGHQGRRLGYWVSLAALHQMVDEGRQRATLLTDDFRLPALKTYLRLGFDPLLVHANQRARWRKVFSDLVLPHLAETYADVLDGPIWQPPQSPTDDFGYKRLVRIRRRHHPGRAPGRPTVGECDTFADESLYQPSRLGRAGITPGSVTAGTNAPFELWFEAGPDGLPAHTEVLFYTPGQNPLGSRPQWERAADAGGIEMRCEGEGSVRPLPDVDDRRRHGEEDPSHRAARGSSLGFRVGSRPLCPGDRVILAVGGEGGFLWTPLAGRKEFKVLVDPGFSEPVMRLPEPVVITVTPDDSVSVEAFVPGTAGIGERVDVVVRLRDRFDNRVRERRDLRLVLGNDRQDTVLQDGWARVTMGPVPDTALCCGAEVQGLDAVVSNPLVPRDTEDRQLFFGDLHVHDLTCPAEGYTGSVYEWGRDEKRLDFVSVAPQCHAWVDNDVWTVQKQACEAFLEEGRFVTISAFEWQHSHYGDKVIHYLGGDQPYLPVDDSRYAHPANLYEALRGSDALVIGHHPGYELDLHVPGTDWDAVETDVERLVEIWSMHGSSEGFHADDEPLRPPRRKLGVRQALQQGLRLGFTGGSDTHSGRPGGSAKEPRPYWGGLCAVWADQLTRRSLFEALHARRTYAIRGRRTVLRFEVNGAPMGSDIRFAETRELRVRVWAPVPIACIDIVRNADRWKTLEAHGLHADLVVADRGDQPCFYHARVTLVDGSLAVCSPVWVG